MRDAAKAIMREIGVDTGGSNVQFAVDPHSGRQVVIEMNPRVSRSSALASKATGYPIAKVAAKLAVGYTLDEIPNDITGNTPASFEPVIDYCVVKIPRWAFEKFPEADETLTTHMKSVGEAMAIGRTFKEAFQKCVRSMEIQRSGLRARPQRPLAGRGARAARGGRARRVPRAGRARARPVLLGSRQGEAPPDTDESTATSWPIDPHKLEDKLRRPCQGRPYYIRYAFKLGWTVEQVHQLTHIDPWFLEQMAELVEFEGELLSSRTPEAPRTALCRAVARSWCSARGSTATAARSSRTPCRCAEPEGRPVGPGQLLQARRHLRGRVRRGHAVLLLDARVAASWSARAASGSAGSRTSSACGPTPHVVVVGGGPEPHRAGDRVRLLLRARRAGARRMGFRTVMINSNPETVSTDYDTSDLLFFEPLTLEDVLSACLAALGAERGEVRGVIVQFGGQTSAEPGRGPAAGGRRRSSARRPRRSTWPRTATSSSEILNELGLRQPRERHRARPGDRGPHRRGRWAIRF